MGDNKWESIIKSCKEPNEPEQQADYAIQLPEISTVLAQNNDIQETKPFISNPTIRIPKKSIGYFAKDEYTVLSDEDINYQLLNFSDIVEKKPSMPERLQTDVQIMSNSKKLFKSSARPLPRELLPHFINNLKDNKEMDPSKFDFQIDLNEIQMSIRKQLKLRKALKLRGRSGFFRNPKWASPKKAATTTKDIVPRIIWKEPNPKYYGMYLVSNNINNNSGKDLPPTNNNGDSDLELDQASNIMEQSTQNNTPSNILKTNNDKTNSSKLMKHKERTTVIKGRQSILSKLDDDFRPTILSNTIKTYTRIKKES